MLIARLFTPAVLLVAFLGFQDWLGVNPLGFDRLGLQASTACAEWDDATDAQRRRFLRRHDLRLAGYEEVAKARCRLYPNEPLGDMATALRSLPTTVVSGIPVSEH